jgi:hypothetical protein
MRTGEGGYLASLAPLPKLTVDAFDAILNRHTAFDPVEVRRIVKPRGRFLPEQVGSDEGGLGSRPARPAGRRTCLDPEVAVGQLEAAGWVIDEVREDHKTMWFSDIAALIGYVRTAPWAFEDLDWTSAKPRLHQLHAQSQSKPIDAISHRFLVLATG